jgi:hypothetical protein
MPYHNFKYWWHAKPKTWSSISNLYTRLYSFCWRTHNLAFSFFGFIKANRLAPWCWHIKTNNPGGSCQSLLSRHIEIKEISKPFLNSQSRQPNKKELIHSSFMWRTIMTGPKRLINPWNVHYRLEVLHLWLCAWEDQIIRNLVEGQAERTICVKIQWSYSIKPQGLPSKGGLVKKW